MTDEFPDADPWTIPLHGTAFAPTSADGGEAPTLGVGGPGADVPPDSPGPAPTADGATGPDFVLPEDEDELPTEGFHPRLRRSA